MSIVHVVSLSASRIASSATRVLPEPFGDSWDNFGDSWDKGSDARSPTRSTRTLIQKNPLQESLRAFRMGFRIVCRGSGKRSSGICVFFVLQGFMGFGAHTRTSHAR